ncbi:hypothetical protein BT67DRAFT_446563 [Trichocladium antarcticum]|uniref:Cyclase n=1 Tax=Trichocladium antarcticum TaxID=1450529 RepID=A0AAN6ZHB9_9PEZI|nr:hypothetical protein BT67DRAFT_446563 [Trichocladium antarcticum]
MDPSAFPDFDDLPKVEGQPQGCAWGIFDKDGKKDVYGTLNFLTPEIVAAAAKEMGMDAEGWDDELDFNTQCSSQWDSLCHITTRGATYNNARPTLAGLAIPSSATATATASPLPTLEHWHARGALVGRGVLIDVKRYRENVLGEAYHPLDGHRITAAEVEAVARHQAVAFRPGDVLVVRTGYTEVLEALLAPGESLPERPGGDGALRLSGLHGVEATARWAWNRRFAAVAGDSHAFEAFPPLKADGTEGGVGDLVLHPWFLNQFGMPIGELWDLKALSEHAKKTGRYSFMLTSVPLNHPGLVASPPNAVAIF